MSQPDKWLLMYGREKAKLVVPSKTALQWFSSLRADFTAAQEKSPAQQ